MKKQKDGPSFGRMEGRTERGADSESICITENRWREEQRGERDKMGRMRDGPRGGRRTERKERGNDTVRAW